VTVTLGYCAIGCNVANLHVSGYFSMMHAGLGREPPLQVEYIHLGAALGVIQDILVEAVLSDPRMMLSKKIAMVKALSKIIWIQNDLFARWAVRDGEEYTNSVDFGMVEKEGWVNGKKILNEDGSSQAPSDIDQVSNAGDQKSCPFAAVSGRMADMKVSGK
jgi:protoglobin